jgi:hypothetical protein
MPYQSLGNIILASQMDALPLEDARTALAAAGRRVSTEDEGWVAWVGLWVTALNTGRPQEAQAALERIPAIVEDPARRDVFLLLSATFGDDDTAAAASVARRLAATESATPTGSSEVRAREFANRCVLEQWKLAHGDTSSVQRTIAFLAGADPKVDESATRSLNSACITLLAAWRAVATRSPDAPRAVAALDSLIRTGLLFSGSLLQEGNLLLARLYEAQGDLPRAVRAIRRRVFGLGVPLYLATYLREEGRLAALTGDREGAIRAYRHYLVLRENPEPPLASQAAEVRVELAKLLGEAQ